MFSRLYPIARGFPSQRATSSLVPPSTLSRSSLHNPSASAIFSRGTFLRPLSSSFPTLAESDAVKCHRLMALSQTGDISNLKKLLESGGGVNLLNYDKRSCLHLAVSSGQADTVKFLVERGANINAVDRFGGTPLSEALDAKRDDIASYLRENGANLGNRQEQLVRKVCEAAAKGLVADLENVYNNSFLTLVESRDYDFRSPLHLAVANGHMDAVKYLLGKGADPTQKDRFGNTALDEARREGHAEIEQLLSGFEREPQPEKEKQAELLLEKRREHYKAVKNLLLKHRLYSEKLILAELDWYYYHLGLPAYYFNRFPPEQAYKHIEAYIAAKQVAFANGTPEDIRIDGVETVDGTLFICPSDSASITRVEEAVDRLSKKWMKEHEGTCLSLYQLTSNGPSIPHGTGQLCLYIVDRNRFDNIESISPEEKDFNLIASPSFATWRQSNILDQFRDIMEEATTRISPTFHILPRHEGLAHVMLAHRRDSYNLPLPTVTRLLESNGISLARKVIEQFGNGVTVYSLYFEPRSEELVRSVLNDMSLMFIARKTTELLPLYFSGEITAKEYAYGGAVSLFVYYFLHHQDEDLEYLFSALKGDPEKLNHLDNIRRSLKQETVSLMRIAHTLRNHPDILKGAVESFEDKFGYDDFDPEAFAKSQQELRDRINKELDNDQDKEIFEHVLLFNEVCVRTNFFKVPKTAISIRIDPAFLGKDKSYPEAPYGVFLMVGNDFHGFHVRFNDVARGGLRLVLSRDKASYGRNLETAFFENYNLAHTQNRKNKDIPEFGSKGVVLLHPPSIPTQERMRAAGEQAFKKYISSFLDLITEQPAIKDYYGKPDIIFCGPDENTADYMQWAAEYAKTKGYPYWKAFTTGKPQSMGGIPHDIYGMTTNSVHQFVLETLADEGLNEEEVTKLQTGGPDGDLGSNEILISKDKTTAIVDGSGVLYDPVGLDRKELEHLAETRKTIDHFDESKLSSEGFKVLVNQNDVRLPDGELVQSGLAFRNDFHLLPYSSADLFVPCGGRPEAVNSKNVHRLLNKDGTPRFKYIVEGANLFFTQEARSFIEDKGVILFKDASTNKGGVTSSSLEVLAALALTEEEHSTHMCFEPGQEVPKFYQEYVEEVQRRVRENARLEYRCLVKERERTGQYRHLLTDALSDKINELTAAIYNSPLYNAPRIRQKVMQDMIPMQLQELVPGGLGAILERLPESYVKACFCTHLASNFVYKYGLAAGDFAFFEYMDEIASEPGQSLLGGDRD